MPDRWPLVLSCEHGGNRLPAAFAERFADAADALASHRGWDPGALPLARALADRFAAPLVVAEVTRLLVDLNRSPNHPKCLSAWTRDLPPVERRALLAAWHAPHRAAVATAVETTMGLERPVIHLAVHTFTPVLDGAVRQAEIGLLYDPARPAERAFCRRWQTALRALAPGWRIRLNYPYRGAADGLPTTLRRRFPADRYLGIELEVNQRLAAGPEAPALANLVSESLVRTMQPAADSRV